MRLLRRALALVCAAVAAVTVGTPVLPTAAAAITITTGNDYSWPQCPKGVGNGQGQPLPPGTHAFAVVGLTNGRALHENPCLASQWAYARAHATLVTGYTMVTYPTATERAAATVGHYGRCTTLACQLRNNGWAQGAFTATSLGRLGARPPLVWIDVEPRTHQPWSRSRANNSLVIKALVASLHARGYTVGVYSNRYLWNEIAGYRTSLPEWVPAQSYTRGCGLSFAGGRVLLSQWTRTHSNGKTYDENGRCAGSPALSTWWQRSHPLVTSMRTSTGSLFARFGSLSPFSLAAKDPHAAVVVAAPSAAGSVPLFVSLTSVHRLHARTLGSGWRTLGTARCAGLPTAAISAGALAVHCTRSDGAVLVTTVPLTSIGAPANAGVTATVAATTATTATTATAAPTRTTAVYLH